MKNKNKFLIVIIAVGLLVGVVFLVVNNQSGEYSITKAYDYPIEVGSDEWNNLKTPEERKAAFSVPQTVIDDMTTKALLETVFTNPFLTDIWAYNSQGNYDKGITMALDNIDGLSELTERENFLEELEAASLFINAKVFPVTLPVTFPPNDSIFSFNWFLFSKCSRLPVIAKDFPSKI